MYNKETNFKNLLPDAPQRAAMAYNHLYIFGGHDDDQKMRLEVNELLRKYELNPLESYEFLNPTTDPMDFNILSEQQKQEKFLGLKEGSDYYSQLQYLYNMQTGNGEVADINIQFCFVADINIQFCFVARINLSEKKIAKFNAPNCVFMDSANFSKVQFSQEANFSNAQFSQEANFCLAKFSQKAYFIEAKFSQKAYFIEAQFSQEAYFIEAQFSQDANFNEAQFSQEAYFIEAQFSQDANFNEAQFSQDANFRKAQFIQLAYFHKSKFNNLHMVNTKFYQMDFQNCKIKDKFDIQPTIIRKTWKFSDFLQKSWRLISWRAIKAKWHAWRNASPMVNFDGIEFILPADSAQINKIILPSGASLRHSIFENCHLRDSELRAVNAQGAKFIKCQLHWTKLSGDFKFCDFTGSDFLAMSIMPTKKNKKSCFNNANFTDVHYYNLDFSQAEIHNITIDTDIENLRNKKAPRGIFDELINQKYGEILNFWREKKARHDKSKKITMGLIGILIALPIILLYALSHLTSKTMAEMFEAYLQYSLEELVHFLPITGVFLSLFYWFLGHLMKNKISHQHLAEDIAQKQVLLNNIILLDFENYFKNDKDKKDPAFFEIMKKLLDKTPDGLIKEEGPILPIEIITKKS